MTAPTDDRTTARETRALIKGAAAALAGRDRGPDAGVRRHSYDVEDPRAQVFRPIGDGTLAGAMSWIDALIRTAREYDRVHKEKGSRGGLGGPHVVTVLEALLGRRGKVAIDFKTGRLDPAYETLQKITGFARTTISRALAKLKEHGFLDWVRRSRRTGNDHEFGPQREQTSNAYFFSLGRLPKAVLRRFLDLVAAGARKRASAAQAALGGPVAHPTGQNVRVPVDSELRSAIETMRASFANASPPDGLYPSSGIKG